MTPIWRVPDKGDVMTPIWRVTKRLNDSLYTIEIQHTG